MKRAIIYLRISSDKQIDNTSLDTQEQICRGYCEREGLQIVDVIKLEAVSAKDTNTLRVAELLEFAKEHQGKFDVLVVFKLDRFARSQEHHHYLRAQLMKMSIVLRSSTERIDESPQGKLVEGVLAAVNEYDNEVRKERVKIAMWRRVEEGLWPWQPPLGFWRPKHPGIRLTVSQLDLACKDAVMEIFTLFSTGVYTYDAISKKMNKKKIKNWEGRTIKFSKQYIQKLINNVFYIKQLRGKDGKLHEGKHDQLIPISLWNRCQEVIAKRTNHAVNKRLYNNPDFPLRRFILCGYCNKPFTACWTKGGSGGKYPYYYCINKNCEKYGKMIPKNTIHDEFCDYLKTVKPKEKFVKLFERAVLKRYKDRKYEIQGEYVRKLEDINKLGDERTWVLEKGKKGVLSDELLKSQLDEIENKLALAKLELSDAHCEEVELDELLAYGSAFIRTCDLAWYDGIFDAKMKYQRMIFPSGVKYHFNGFSNSELGLPFELISSFATKKSTDVTSPGIEPGLLG